MSERVEMILKRAKQRFRSEGIENEPPPALMADPMVTIFPVLQAQEPTPTFTPSPNALVPPTDVPPPEMLMQQASGINILDPAAQVAPPVAARQEPEIPIDQLRDSLLS